MMGILEKIWFFMFVLPVIMFVDGVTKFQHAIKEKHYIDALLYVLIAILVVAVIVLLFLGFR